MTFGAIDQKFGFKARGPSQCLVCGVECDSYPLDGTGAICPAHCPDHEYEYERGVGYYCKICGQEPPHDWWGYDPPEPH